MERIWSAIISARMYTEPRGCPSSKNGGALLSATLRCLTPRALELKSTPEIESFLLLILHVHVAWNNVAILCPEIEGSGH